MRKKFFKFKKIKQLKLNHLFIEFIYRIFSFIKIMIFQKMLKNISKQKINLHT